jgi:hypothetical protein
VKYVGKTKIGKFSSKPNVIDPQLGLPQWLANTIGKITHIHATEYNAKKALLFVLEDQDCANSVERSPSQVLRPSVKIIKPEPNTGSDCLTFALARRPKAIYYPSE